MGDVEKITALEAEVARLTHLVKWYADNNASSLRIMEDLSRALRFFLEARYDNGIAAKDDAHPSPHDPYDVRVRLLTEDERAQKQAEAEANAAKWRTEQEGRRDRIKGKSHVYFIQQGDSGAIKIGCSKNPSQRLQSLQTGHSEPLRLLTCAVGSQAQERALHDRFAHLRVSGEWFRPADDLLAYIRLVNDRRAL